MHRSMSKKKLFKHLNFFKKIKKKKFKKNQKHMEAEKCLRPKTKIMVVAFCAWVCAGGGCESKTNIKHIISKI